MADDFLVNARQFQFELVAPEKVEVSGLEERVILPGEEGDFMVLAGHELLLAGLRPGVITVLHANNHAVRYFIDGGFADVGNTHCTVLTPHITPVNKLIADRLSRDIEHLQSELANQNDEAVKIRMEKDLEILTLKLETAEKYNI
jgi:F-type H+-transporting ATPase subunit epsilon